MTADRGRIIPPRQKGSVMEISIYAYGLDGDYRPPEYDGEPDPAMGEDGDGDPDQHI